MNPRPIVDRFSDYRLIPFKYLCPVCRKRSKTYKAQSRKSWLNTSGLLALRATRKYGALTNYPAS